MSHICLHYLFLSIGCLTNLFYGSEKRPPFGPQTHMGCVGFLCICFFNLKLTSYPSLKNSWVGVLIVTYNQGPSAPFGGNCHVPRGNSWGKSEMKLPRVHHTQKAIKTTSGVWLAITLISK